MRAAKIEFDDEAILNAPYAIGNEIIVRDPLLRGHRLTIKRRTKSFELQIERPRAFGPRRTYVLVTGTAPFTKIEAARKKAIDLVNAVKEGKDPSESGPRVTVVMAWERFKCRPGLRPRSLRSYESLYKRHLVTLAETPLATLSAQPAAAENFHAKLTKEGSPVDANRALQLLRAIYRDAARRDRTLVREHHPCTSVRWNAEESAAEEKFIPPEMMPAWAKQIEKLRKSNPWRASYQMLLLRLGCRPNELAVAKWADLDFGDGVLVIPVSKTGLYEIPLCRQAIEEFERWRSIAKKLHPDSPYICPPTFAEAAHPRYTERKTVLAYSGSAGRTTHHSIGVALGVTESAIDVIEGRTLKKTGALAAGRHYLARTALGPAAKKAQRAINNQIDKLLGDKIKGKARGH